MKILHPSLREPRSAIPWRSILWTSLAVLGLIVLLLHTAPARADIAPPESPPGSNPAPGTETTQVRMVSEKVLLDVKERSASKWLGQARVTADFQMRNLGKVKERLEVRFPLSTLNGWGDGFGNFPEIPDFQVKVKGKAYPSRRITTPNPNGAGDSPLPWAAFQVTFPPGEDVPIQVTYTADAFGEYSFMAFKYILETGAGWKDTIGSADLIVRLPYEANLQNVIIGDATGFSETTPGATLSGNEVRWHFENLEPTQGDNLEVTLIVPEAWESVLAERENVRRNPKDGEAWGRLGKAYKEIITYRRGLRQDDGGMELYPLSVEAYSNSVRLKPKDALWHYGFADLLWIHYYYYVYWAESDTSELVRVIDELRQSLELNPKEQRALDLAQEIQYSIPGVITQDAQGSFTYLIYTATPDVRQSSGLVPTPTETLAPAATPSPTGQPAASAQVADTPQPTKTPAPPSQTPTERTVPLTPTGADPKNPANQGSRPPLCGGAAAIPVAFVSAALFFSRKKRLEM